VADHAKDVTTQEEIAQYALIIPFSAKKGAVLLAALGGTALGGTWGTSKNMHG
jgi:hypothetical protein